MGSLSIWHWVIVLAIPAAIVIGVLTARKPRRPDKS
jgi:Sec-independent protein translocase protein TatA